MHYNLIGNVLAVNHGKHCRNAKCKHVAMSKYCVNIVEVLTSCHLHFQVLFKMLSFVGSHVPVSNGSSNELSL